ncbi:STAS domain-containing protein [uncultured Roseibium sp.]|uniref:STAS domain-containing protein n=1 Tax=uncultured Roseibium sp. TaxID=1936171 RepID=UPI0032170D32
MSSGSDDKACAYVLPEVLDIGVAPSLKEGLIEVGSETDQITVDGSKVERVSTPGVQVLAAAARDFAAEGRSFQLRDASQSLVFAFEDLGLAEDLKRWSSH